MAAYRLTSAASDDIATIFVEAFKRFGLAQADKYHNGLTKTFDFLSSFPRAARLRDEIDPPVRAFRFKSHMIIYELDKDDVVIVLRVRYGHEDWIEYIS